MIAINEIQGNEERYNWWLTIMPDTLMYLSTLPREIRKKLDYSVDSLDVIEKYLMENYELAEMKLPENKLAIDLFARYIGETFRKNLTDIIWEMEKKEGWFGYGFPLLIKKDNKPCTPKSVFSLLGGALDRKSGNYLSTILKNNIEDEMKWEGRKPE